MSNIPLSAFYGISLSNGATTASGYNPYTITKPVSGYSLATPFTCSLIFDNQYTQAAVTTNYNIIWWFGDGTYSNSFSPTHTYNWPGIYEIKIGIFNNTPGASATQTFSLTATVSNYIQDNLQWDYTVYNNNQNNYVNGNNYDWLTLMRDLSTGQPSTGACFFGYQSCKSGSFLSGPLPLTVNYYTSVLSNSSLNFKFYSQNSLSQPWTQALDSQLANLRPRWRFTTAPTAPLTDGDIIPETGYTPISSTPIYIDSRGNSALSSTGTLVGLSGSFSFYYIDDMPSMAVNSSTVSANPVTIWTTLDTSNLPNPQDFEYTSVPSYSNSVVTLSSFYYVQKLLPDHINVSINGKLPFYSVFWPHVESRFVTTINAASAGGTAEFTSNAALLNYPLYSPGNTFLLSFSAQSNNTTYNPATATFNSSTKPQGYTLVYQISSLDLNGHPTGGAYIGTFTPLITASTGLLYSRISGVFYYTSDLTPNITTGYNPLTISTAASSYTNYTTSTLSGTSVAFTVPDFNSTYFARKFGANFDFGAQIKAFALQPTIAQNNVLFDNFFPAVAGISATNEDTYGGVVFEKINNFVANIADPTVSNLNMFYSLAQSVGIDLDNYNYDIPPTLKRIVDTYSTQQSYVWGANSTFARNFSLSGGLLNFTNPVIEYNILTTMVSAGQQIIVNDKLNSPQSYELLQVSPITSYSSVTARNLQGLLPTSAYPASSYPLTYYPLSAFYGWGLKTPVNTYYRFFQYNPYVDNSQKEGLINWNDPITTLSRSASSHSDWVKDEGILETIFNYYIHKGLGLIK